MTPFITTLMWTVLLFVCLKWHLDAWKEFGKDAAAVKRLHQAGFETPQMVSWAGNQLLRYQYRVIESLFGILIGFNGIAGIWYPRLIHNPAYSFGVLTFFFVLIAASGYLSRRDVRLRRRLRKEEDPLPPAPDPRAL